MAAGVGFWQPRCCSKQASSLDPLPTGRAAPAQGMEPGESLEADPALLDLAVAELLKVRLNKVNGGERRLRTGWQDAGGCTPTAAAAGHAENPPTHR